MDTKLAWPHKLQNVYNIQFAQIPNEANWGFVIQLGKDKQRRQNQVRGQKSCSTCIRLTLFSLWLS